MSSTAGPLGSGYIARIAAVVGSGNGAPIALLPEAGLVRSTGVPLNVNLPDLNAAVGTMETFVRVVRKRDQSLLTKKKVLFFTMGPPTEKPKMFLTYGFFCWTVPSLFR